jgi:hypothetical protein
MAGIAIEIEGDGSFKIQGEWDPHGRTFFPGTQVKTDCAKVTRNHLQKPDYANKRPRGKVKSGKSKQE